MSKKTKKSAFKTIFWVLIFLISFGAMAWVGKGFIEQVGQEADGIRSDVNAPSLVENPDIEALNQMQPSAANNNFSGSLNNVLYGKNSISASNGEDASIQAGDLIWQNNQPVLRLELLNQGNFPIKTVHAGISLYTEGQNEAITQTSVIQLPLIGTLETGESQQIRLPISHQKWYEAMQTPQKLRVLVQLVSVSSAEQMVTDYPQMSQAVVLKAYKQKEQTPQAVEIHQESHLFFDEAASETFIPPEYEIEEVLEMQTEILPENILREPKIEFPAGN